jgi:hypothetical protein
MHRAQALVLAQLNAVAHTHLTRGLGLSTIHPHAAQANFVSGQAAGFVKPRRPQPLVEPHVGLFCGWGLGFVGHVVSLNQTA